MTDTAAELLFDLTLTDEQRMNRETMQRFAAVEMRALGRAVDTGQRPAAEFLPATADLGLTLLPIPEALGGAGVEATELREDGVGVSAHGPSVRHARRAKLAVG